MTKPIERVVVLGANGAMGAGSGALFASAGIPTVFLARTVAKAEAGKAKALAAGKGTIDESLITCGSYDELALALADADLVLEAVSEDLATKHAMFAQVDAARRSDAIVGTVSSGLSISELCRDRSASFASHFLGIHLFNPPLQIRGCEVIAHAGTDALVASRVVDFLTRVCKREVVACADTPAFAGNRLGFRLLNSIARLVDADHSPLYLDTLFGKHTGRALAPLATIDLVGWDVHAAIVDNLFAKTGDPAFILPAVMRRGIAAGVLGRKAKDKGGFFTKTSMLDPDTLAQVPMIPIEPPPLVTRMRGAFATDGVPGAMAVLFATDAACPHAELMRHLVLDYIGYGQSLVGEVVAEARDVDRIMEHGFGWVSPGALLEAIGNHRLAA